MRAVRESSQTLQRIKVGVIGLAAVVLLIGLASAIMRTANRAVPATAAGGAKPEIVANMVDGNSAADSGGEPLTELGVAPSIGNSAAPSGSAR